MGGGTRLSEEVLAGVWELFGSKALRLPTPSARLVIKLPQHFYNGASSIGLGYLFSRPAT